MPVYEYICTACDHRSDILHGINDPGPHFCPSCGREGTMRKLIAAPAIHYRGSGWAKKDRSATSRSAKSTSKSDGDGGGDRKDGGDKKDGGGDTSAGGGDTKGGSSSEQRSSDGPTSTTGASSGSD
jgi:putative FmdB family regulatory protein